MAALVIRRIRSNLRHERVFQGRLNPLDYMDDDELYVAFRFRRHKLSIICDELTDYLIGLL